MDSRAGRGKRFNRFDGQVGILRCLGREDGGKDGSDTDTYRILKNETVS